MKLINELCKSIELANSRGAYKLSEASYIHKVLIDLQKEIDKQSSKKPLVTIQEDLVIKDDDGDVEMKD